MRRRMYPGAAAVWAGGASIGSAHFAATPYIIPAGHLPRVVPTRATFAPYTLYSPA